MTMELDLVINRFAEAEICFMDFEEAYDKLREKALKDENLYLDLEEQILKDARESNAFEEAWKKMFTQCGLFVQACSKLSRVGDSSEKQEILKNEIKGQIVNMITTNMQLFQEEGAEPYNESEKYLSVIVYADILTAFMKTDEKIRYLAILWDALVMTDLEPEMQAFYGENARRVLLERSRENLSLCGIKQKNIKTMLEYEKREYVLAFENALLEKDDRNLNKKKDGPKEKRNIAKILSGKGKMKGLIAAGALGFCVGVGGMLLLQSTGIVQKEEKAYTEMNQKYEALLEEKDSIEGKYEQLLEENQNLKKEEDKLRDQIEDLKARLKDEAFSGEYAIVLKEFCDFRDSASDSSSDNIIQVLLPETEVTVTEELENGWLKIAYDGQEGYIRYTETE